MKELDDEKLYNFITDPKEIKRIWLIYTIDTAIMCLIVFGINFLFFSETTYFQTFGDQFEEKRIALMFKISQEWQWFGYVFIPIVIFVRIGFTSICLYTGCFLTNLKIRFKDLFRIVLLADFVFVLAGIAKLVILIFFKEVSRLDDLQFQPLSLIELLNKESIDKLFFYPLSLINVFELLYWLALAWLLMGLGEKPFGSSLKTVVSSYGVGLALWVLFVMFLTVNLT